MCIIGNYYFSTVNEAEIRRNATEKTECNIWLCEAESINSDRVEIVTIEPVEGWSEAVYGVTDRVKKHSHVKNGTESITDITFQRNEVCFLMPIYVIDCDSFIVLDHIGQIQYMQPANFLRYQK